MGDNNSNNITNYYFKIVQNRIKESKNLKFFKN